MTRVAEPSGERPHPALNGLARQLAMVAAVIAMAWFLFPILRGTYTEGFEPMIGINADRLLAGRPEEADTLYPFNQRFFLVTRLGITLLLGGANLLDGLPTLANFRGIMFASVLLLVGATAFILRRKYQVHPVFGCLACFLLPPVFESAYFFNDNLLSAGVATLAFALFWTRLSLPATAVAALLMGIAMATRPDALLLTPAFAVVAHFEIPDWRTRIRHALVASPILVAVPFGLYAVCGLSFLDVFAVAPRALTLWNRQFTLWTYLGHVLNGLSLPAMVILPVGLLRFFRLRQWREILLCFGVPLLYVAAYGSSLFQLRYLIPLTPLLAIAIVEGGRAVLQGRSLVLRAMLAAALLACFVPPRSIPVRALTSITIDYDGPRPFLGRFWSPMVWSAWLERVNHGVEAMRDAVTLQAQAQPTSAVVSETWTADRLVHLTLLELGFRQRVGAGPPACRTVAEVFVRGATTILHVRLHVPFVADAVDAVVWRDLGPACLEQAGLAASPLVLATWRTDTASDADGLSLAARLLRVDRWLSYFSTYQVARIEPAQVAAQLRQPQSLAQVQEMDRIMAARADLLR